MRAGDPVILVRRYQQGSDSILCSLECYLSYPACDFVFQELNEVAQGSIHPYLARHSGCFIDDYLVRITAYAAASEEGLLKASKGDVVCKIVSSGYAEETRKPIYYEITKYIPERMNFILHYHN
jgi:DNA-binding GntR family transcriptional regulator